MPKQLSHDEISTQFLESGALNHEAMGAFVAKLGPELVVRDLGIHGVIHGRFNTLACFLRADDLGGVFGGLGFPGLADAVDVQRS